MMNYEIEYEIIFGHGGKVYLVNTDDKREKIDVSNFGLNEEDHNHWFIVEGDIKSKSTYKGKVAQTIKVDGEYYHNSPPKGEKIKPKKYSAKTKKRKIRNAFAPYNFVPLNRNVSESDNNSDHSTYAPDMHSGYIDYDIQNLTDLFIREQNEKHSFFGKSLNKERIPGSSMRGLVRTLYEIITYSKIGETDSKRRFFNRRVGRDMSRYKERILDNQRAGWLMQKEGRYFLVDAKSIAGDKNYIKVAVESIASKKDHKFINKVRDRNDVYIEWDKLGIKESQYAHNDVYVRIERGAAKDIAVEYSTGLEPCILFQTGHIFSKKHQYLIGDRNEEVEGWDVTESINLNISDTLRANEYKLFGNLHKNKNIWYPCFYIKEVFEEKEEYLIGETPMFRLPYEKRVKELLPSLHKDEKEDLATNVFGSTQKATKVYFEDAFANGRVEYASVTGIKMLSDPKPTSFSHYAVDGTSYDDKAIIRGNKMYWHKKEEEYKLDYSNVEEDKRQQYSPEIEPIIKAKFTGRVRFDNLSKEELGALLFIFNLPEQMAVKLGMGKPYGLGSVKISNCRLKIIDRVKRYAEVFDSTNNWNISEDSGLGIETLIQGFIGFVSQYDTQITSRDDFFKSNRMSQLAAMLTFDHKVNNWLSKTSYMELREFREDSILPNPTEHLKNN